MTEYRDFSHESVFESEVIAASGSVISGGIDVSNKKKDHLSLHIKLTGSGTVTIAYEVSGKLQPASADFVAGGDLATGVAAGTYVYAVAPAAVPFIRFKVTETGGAHSVTVAECFFFGQKK